MPGYNITILNEGDRADKFLCMHCRLLLRDPQQSQCGHRFCRSCVDSVLSGGNQYDCPECMADDPSEDSLLTLDTIYPDRAIKREMKDLKTKCINLVCKWLGPFQQYELHILSCPYGLVECPRVGCEEEVARQDVDTHLAEYCIMRVIQCEFCGEDIIAKDLQAHLSICRRFPVDCEFCGLKVIREKLREHIDFENGDCPRKRKPCKFHDIGCKVLVEVGKEANHSAQAFEEHMDLLLQGALKLKQFREDLEQRAVQYRQLTVSVEDHEGILNNLRLHLGRLENDLRNIPSEARSEFAEGDTQTLSQMMDKIGRTISELQSKSGVLETKVSSYEGIIAVLNGEVEQNADMVQKMKRDEQKLRDTLSAIEKKTKAQDRIIALKDVTLAEQDLRIQSLEMASYDGILTWKISEFGRKRHDAISGRTLSLYSPYFFSSQFGYKMCARIYLNGDGMGKGNHVSLFFVVMKGENDAILRWPFKQKVTFMWIDQSNREHMIDAFRPDPNSSSFKRPTGDMNIASGCPLFMPLTMLDDGKHAYVKDDTAFLRITIDTSDI